MVDLLREFAIFVDKAAQVSELGGLGVLLPRCFDDKWWWRRSPFLWLFLRRPHQESLCLLLRHCQAKFPKHFHDNGHHSRQPFLGSRYDAGVVGIVAVVVVFFTLTDRASTIPSNIHVVANPVRGHKEVPRSTGHIMVTTRYSDQQGSKSRQEACDSTSNGTDQYQNGSSSLLTPYREQPRSTRIIVNYPRPAFSATKRTNYAPTSFDQQVQVSQGHTSYKNKEN